MNRRAFIAAATGALASPWLVGAAEAAYPSGIPASEVLAQARALLGVPYVYGGVDPRRGLDCSAYVSLIWRIPRRTTDNIQDLSRPIARAELMPGDALNLPFVGRRSHMRLFAGWATEDRRIAWMYEAARGRGVAYRVVGDDPSYTPIRRLNVVPDVPLPPIGDLPLDYDVPNGRFFSQTGAADGRSGFAVLNGDGVQLWNEYRRLGGFEALGYPLTRRFDSHGVVVQVLQRGVLHWRSDERRADVGPPPLHPRQVAPPEALVPELSPFLAAPA